MAQQAPPPDADVAVQHSAEESSRPDLAFDHDVCFAVPSAAYDLPCCKPRIGLLHDLGVA